MRGHKPGCDMLPSRQQDFPQTLFACVKQTLQSQRCLSSPWGSGSVPAGCFHHHGGPEMAALLPHLHLSLPLLLDALRYDLVAAGLCSWRPGAS